MRQAKTGWKWAIALFSLLLTVLIWRQGLKESFQRSSVAPKISVMQTEMAVSASSSIPENIQNLFLGSEPQEKLYQAFKKIPLERFESERKRRTCHTYSDSTLTHISRHLQKCALGARSITRILQREVKCKIRRRMRVVSRWDPLS